MVGDTSQAEHLRLSSARWGARRTRRVGGGHRGRGHPGTFLGCPSQQPGSDPRRGQLGRNRGCRGVDDLVTNRFSKCASESADIYRECASQSWPSHISVRKGLLTVFHPVIEGIEVIKLTTWMQFDRGVSTVYKMTEVEECYW